MTAVIDRPLTRFRLNPSRGAEPVVNRTGGSYGAGMITGVSAITRGEALGHYAWVDRFAVEQVVSLGNATKRGVKVRFTHPSLSGDGMGKLLGRAKNFRLSEDGDRALMDLHFEQSAHNTPDGDLASYVMDMAEEDAEAFGTSIVFDHDRGAEDRFEAEHEDKDGNFSSPDPDNASGLRHIRLAKLWADDVVDDPAANPGGLFRRGQEIAEEADRLCEFALGLRSERPITRHLSVDAERLAGFASRFLEHHQLELKEKPMADKGNSTPAAVTEEQLNAAIDKALTGFTAKLDEKLAALKPTEKKEGEPTQPTADELRAEGAKRAASIMAFAATSGLADHGKLAQEAIEKNISLESFKASITDRLLATNGLTKDEGEKDADPHAKFREEYNADVETFNRMGVQDVDAYIRTRCRDEGLPVPPIKKAG